MSRIEKVEVVEPAQAPSTEVLLEIVRGPISGTLETGRSYIEWHIFVPKSESDATCAKHSEIVSSELDRENYERCIIAGMSLEEAFESTRQARIRRGGRERD